MIDAFFQHIAWLASLPEPQRSIEKAMMYQRMALNALSNVKKQTESRGKNDAPKETHHQ